MKSFREGSPDPELAEVEAIYRGRYQAFLRTAAAIVGDDEIARDVVQEAFASAVRKRRTRRRQASLEPWIWRIVLNAAKDERRRRRVREHPAGDVERNGYRSTDADPAVRRALLGLPEQQRRAVFLRYYAELDYARIADVLQVAPGTVGATLSSARSALRKKLEEE